MTQPERATIKSSEILAFKHEGYSIGREIGQGAYATVRIADYVDKSNGRLVKLACKIFDKEKAPEDVLTKFFPRELEVLKKIDSPNLIQVKSILERGPRVFIFMRFAENGDLFDYIKKAGPLAERNARTWFLQLSKGLEYLHNLNIAHRDLKCENILITKRYNVKIADFGFARSCIDKENRRIISRTYCGSAGYAAPEIISGTPYNPKLADIWSLGIVLFIMLNAAMPFDESNLKRLYAQQMQRSWKFRSKVKNVLSNKVKNLVTQILEPDITKRIRLNGLIHHEWLLPRKKAPNATIVDTSPVPPPTTLTKPNTRNINDEPHKTS